MYTWRKWNPFAEMDLLRREIDRVFEGFGGKNWNWRSAFLPGSNARSYPLVNLSENEEEIVVEALAPGLDPQSLDVSIKGSTLTITGEKLPLEDVSPEAYHRNERAAGKFVRSIELETEIEENKVSARYENGILLVTMPKSEKAKPRQITVDVK